MNPGYLYVAGTIVGTVYGQLIIKWQVDKAGSLPETTNGKLNFFVHLVLNPWVISVFVGAALAAFSWMAAMTRFELSRVYPFMALSFVLVLIFSVLLFGGHLSVPKVVGILLIFCGLAVGSQ
jgi:uncharacterized membrane protein